MMDLMIEESTTEKVPKLLENIIKSILERKKSKPIEKIDILCGLLTAMLIENNLIHLNDSGGTKDNIPPENYHCELFYKSADGPNETCFAMRGFQNIPITVVMTPLGDTAIINAILKSLKMETHSTCLRITQYVVSSTVENVPCMFRDLKNFAHTVKNNIISPVKSSILKYYGYPSASLVGIPEEILWKILLNLPVEDILSLCKTCNALKTMIDDNCLWHELYKRDYKKDPQLGNKDWKKQYVEKYIYECNHRAQVVRQMSETVNDYRDYPHVLGYVNNPLWDTI